MYSMLEGDVHIPSLGIERDEGKVGTRGRRPKNRVERPACRH